MLFHCSGKSFEAALGHVLLSVEIRDPAIHHTGNARHAAPRSPVFFLFFVEKGCVGPRGGGGGEGGGKKNPRGVNPKKGGVGGLSPKPF